MHVEEAPPPRRNVSSSVLADWPEVIARELENEAPSDAEEEKDDEPSPKARRSSPSSTDKKRNREQVKEEAADDDDAKDQKGERKKLPRPEGRQPCPRCSSNDTKFCYYNNYNIKQPRFYCKTCQRYWTAGGTLRNIAPGSGRRKSKCAPSRESSKLSSHFSEQLHVVQPSVLGGVPMVQAGPFPGIAHVDSLVVQSLPRLGSGAAETTSLGMLQGGAGPVPLMPQGALLGHPAGGARWGAGSLAELSAGPGGLRDLQVLDASGLAGVSMGMGPLDSRLLIVGGPGAGVGPDDRLPASMQPLSHAVGQGVNGISPSPSPSPPPALLHLRAQQSQQQASSPARQGGGGSQTSQPATAATGGNGNGAGTVSEDSDRPDEGCVQQGKLLRPKADQEAPSVPEIGRGEPGAFVPCPASRLLQAAGSLEAAAMGRQGSGSGSLNPSPVPALHPALMAHMQERGTGSSSNSSTGMLENGGGGNGGPANGGVGAGLVARQVQQVQASQLQQQQQQSTAALHLALLQHQQQQEQQQQQLLTQMALQHHLSQQQLLQQLGSHHHQAAAAAELQRSALLGLGPGVTAGWPAGAVHAAPGAFMPTGTAGGLLHPSMVSGVVSVPMPVATTLLHPVAVTAVPQGVGVGSATAAAAATAGSSGPMSSSAAAAVPGSQDWISMAAASAAAGGATKPQAVHPHQAAAAMAAIQAAVGSGPAGAAPMLAGSVGGGAPSGSAWAAAAAASGPQGLVSSASAVPQLIWTPYASAYGSAPALAGAVGTYTL